ncbi:U-scoloptoxin(01)-Cw1a-like [Asterias rubens]|uniref:U-scoloptoxin(01)-Cw1a-like n=1 Tax=Asterias rubens TaxID=7604 RepID=UPI0014558E18|nr:U-scoloptoxin(01)-Cw1a-like [Asterias rubens]
MDTLIDLRLIVLLAVYVVLVEALPHRRQASVADVSSTVTFTCNGKASGYYADPETCRMYYVCDSGDIYRLPCDLGTYFDPVTITCSLIEDVPCNAPNLPLFCDSRQDGVFPDIDDCSSFYICVFSLTYPISCVDGLIWNQDFGKLCLG